MVPKPNHIVFGSQGFSKSKPKADDVISRREPGKEGVAARAYQEFVM